MRNWTAALALAPMVMGLAACSGDGTTPDAGTSTPDTGVQVPTDSGVVANDDAGTIADAGLDLDAGPVDSGVTPDAGQPEPDAGTPDAGDPMNCTYPAGAVEPMALNEVMTPYRWDTAFRTNTPTQLDLTRVHCNTDPDIDWSPFDVLLFISIPAW